MRIEYARQQYQGDIQNWGWNGSVDTFADLAFGSADMLRVGTGTGNAIYGNDNGYGRAANVGMDVMRGAGLFALFGGAVTRFGGPIFESDFCTINRFRGATGRFNPFKGKTAQEIDGMFRGKGYQPRGPDPMNGRGTYVNPKNGRGFHIDANHPLPKGPHVGAHRPRGLRDKIATRDFEL